MHKLTALTVALSLSAAGQAFAGTPHAPTAHAPAAHAPAPRPQATSQASTSHAPTGRQVQADTDLSADLVKAGEASRNYKASSSVISVAKEAVDTLGETIH